MTKKPERDLVKTFYAFEKDEQKERFVEQMKQEILSSNNEIYLKMLRINERNVKSYKSDFFVHDYNSLLEYDKEFLWLVRDHGTYFLPLEDEQFLKDGTWLWKSHFEAIQHTSRVKLYYHYNPTKNKLIKIDSIKAEIIINEYSTKHKDKKDKFSFPA